MQKIQQVMRYFIVDDDDLSREMFNRLMESIPNVQLCGSFPNGENLISMYKKLKPSLVFLDIMMPGESGLNLALQLQQTDPDVKVVFVTAHSNSAVEAFKLDAVDYLVKPFDRDAMLTALNKVRNRMKSLVPDTVADLSIVGVRKNHEIIFLQKNRILYIEKELRKTIIHTLDGKHITNEPLNALQIKLGSDFFRTHKSFLVNINRIARIYPFDDRAYQVEFDQYPSGALMGRQAYKDFCDFMQKRNLI